MDQLLTYYEEHAALAQVVVVLLVAVVSFFACRQIVVRLLLYTAHKTKAQWDDFLVHHGVFAHLPYLAPAAVFFLFAGAFPEVLVEPLRRLTTAYIALNVVILVDRFLNAGLAMYQTFEVAQKRPIKGYIQITKIFVFVIGGIVVISLLLNQSPWVFLGGLGAMTAVILLIFRDTILSFVASIMIASNDMVRVGDWVEMPKYGADGDVIDMALNTVKVQNWDKTITTIPTYKLVEDSFKNWRGMQASGGRRIARCLTLDMSTVRFLDQQSVDELKKIDILKPYLEAKEQELAAQGTSASVGAKAAVLNGRRLTNVGTFRAYVVAYLKHHPRIRQDMTFLVRQLEPSSTGLPLQIYVFTNTVVWAEYEGIQADVFDHLFAAVPLFGLRLFQAPTGQDIAGLAPQGRG
jgi:miniconductance mechanosensitive channel